MKLRWSLMLTITDATGANHALALRDPRVGAFQRMHGEASARVCDPKFSSKLHHGYFRKFMKGKNENSGRERGFEPPTN